MHDRVAVITSPTVTTAANPVRSNQRTRFIHIGKAGGTYARFCIRQFYQPDKIAILPPDFDDCDETNKPLNNYMCYLGHVHYKNKIAFPTDTCTIILFRNPLDRFLSSFFYARRKYIERGFDNIITKHTDPVDSLHCVLESNQFSGFGFFNRMTAVMLDWLSLDSETIRLLKSERRLPEISDTTACVPRIPMDLQKNLYAGAERNLELIDLIGVYEDLTGFVRILEQYFGAPIQTPGRRFHPSGQKGFADAIRKFEPVICERNAWDICLYARVRELVENRVIAQRLTVGE